MARKKKVQPENKEVKFVLPAGKYVIGDIKNMFTDSKRKEVEKALKPFIKKNSNFGKDDSSKYYYFSCSEKCYDLIEFNGTILTPSKRFILTDVDNIKSGKLMGCKRFSTKEDFIVKPDYTDEDFAVYFQEKNGVSPFMIWQAESTI